MSYKNIITRTKINQIRLWEPLETQKVQTKKHMKYAKEFGYAGLDEVLVVNFVVTILGYGTLLVTILL